MSTKKNQQQLKKKKQNGPKRLPNSIQNEPDFKKPDTPGGRRARPVGKMPQFVPTDPNAFIKATGGHGVDPTAQANQSKLGLKDNLSVQGMSTLMDVKASISTRTLPLAAMGMVLTAIRNGWMSGIKTGENPYYAFVYLCNVLDQALEGAAPTIQNAPKALWDFIAAIRPKAGTFKTASVKYEWFKEATGRALDPAFQLGTDQDPYYVFFGTISTSQAVNGYMALEAPVLPIPEGAGAASFQSMCNYLYQTPGSRMSGDITGLSPLLKDTSAFAVCFPEIGSSPESEGGAANTIYSERQIAVPLLAKLAKYQPDGQYYRGWTHAGKSAGTPCYILPRMLEFTNQGQLYNKASPVFKFFNFDEIFTALSTSLSMALTNFYSNNANTNVTSCVLTPQEVQLLLRQAILSVMHNHLAQDLILGNDFTEMAPFVVGPNGVSIDQANMLLPTVITENIRAMCRRQVRLNTEYKDYCADYIPILGRPINQPQLGNYSVTIGGSNYLLYTDNPSEVPIRLVDASAQVGPNTVYLALNGTAASLNLAYWNDWITSISSCLSPLTTIGAESGITALSTIFYTGTQQDIPTPQLAVVNPALLQKTNSQQNVLDPRVKLLPCTIPLQKKAQPKNVLKNFGSARKHEGASAPVPVNPTYIDTWTEKEIFSNQKVTAPIFRFVRDLIIPCHLSLGEKNQASIQTWQSFMIEPYKVPKTEAGGFGGDFEGVFPTINSRLLRLAAYDVKAYGSADQQNSFVEDLVELGKKGRGGFFAQIAGTLGGFLLPGMGNTIEGVAESLGL